MSSNLKVYLPFKPSLNQLFAEPKIPSAVLKRKPMKHWYSHTTKEYNI
jgi:hypothetical protein